MARGFFRTSKDVCLYCGFRDGKPMPHKIGTKNSPTYLCEKCFQKRRRIESDQQKNENDKAIKQKYILEESKMAKYKLNELVDVDGRITTINELFKEGKITLSIEKTWSKRNESGEREAHYANLNNSQYYFEIGKTAYLSLNKQQFGDEPKMSDNSKQELTRVNAVNESQQQALKDVKEYICHEYLNLHDPSVGFYAVGSLDESVIKEIEEETIKVLSYDEQNAFLDVDGVKIELFIDNEKWDARIVA